MSKLTIRISIAIFIGMAAAGGGFLYYHDKKADEQKLSDEIAALTASIKRSQADIDKSLNELRDWEIAKYKKAKEVLLRDPPKTGVEIVRALGEPKDVDYMMVGNSRIQSWKWHYETGGLGKIIMCLVDEKDVVSNLYF